jgi:hypothetical protein
VFFSTVTSCKRLNRFCVRTGQLLPPAANGCTSQPGVTSWQLEVASLATGSVSVRTSETGFSTVSHLADRGRSLSEAGRFAIACHGHTESVTLVCHTGQWPVPSLTAAVTAGLSPPEAACTLQCKLCNAMCLQGMINMRQSVRVASYHCRTEAKQQTAKLAAAANCCCRCSCSTAAATNQPRHIMRTGGNINICASATQKHAQRSVLVTAPAAAAHSAFATNTALRPKQRRKKHS